jgi:tetratricopeptide (TPR) repeat protein
MRLVLDVLTRLPMPDSREPEGAEPVDGQKPANSAPMSAEAAKTTVRVFDRLQSHSIALPAPLRLRQLRYMTLASPDEMKALYDAANKASTESKEIGLQAFDIVVEALGASDRPRRTLEFLEMASAMPGPNAEAFTRAWLGKIVTLGNAWDARRLIDRSDERGLRVLLVLLSRVPADVNGAALKAEAAYRMGAEVGAFSREAESEEMYRLALEYQPDHALASNDLGYGYVDKGERMEEAERLILTAYRREPNKGTITDSVGWLRYKQGRFVDSTDPTTGALIEGATTLLLRASAIDEDSRNDALIHEHLGDAMWRAGRTEEAKRAWKSSESISGATLTNLGIGGREVQNSPRLANFKKLYEKSFEGVKAKLRAANEGKVPDVAPLAPGK